MKYDADYPQVLILLFPFADGAKSLPDVEQIFNACVKQLDAADQPTRLALAKLAAHVLSFTQVEHVVVLAEPPKKPKKADGLAQAEDDEPVPPPQEVKRLLSLNDMLSQLSAQFNKLNTTRRARIGIFDCYVALLK